MGRTQSGPVDCFSTICDCSIKVHRTFHFSIAEHRAGSGHNTVNSWLGTEERSVWSGVFQLHTTIFTYYGSIIMLMAIMPKPIYRIALNFGGAKLWRI